MATTLKAKALVYCFRGDELLVFTQPEAEAGIQAPAGTVRDGEPPAAAAMRELREETGRDEFEIVGFVGRTYYDQAPYRDEVHERHFFVARPTAALPDRWQGREEHDGEQAPTLFDFFWLPARLGHVLVAGQGALLGLAVRSHLGWPPAGA